MKKKIVTLSVLIVVAAISAAAYYGRMNDCESRAVEILRPKIKEVASMVTNNVFFENQGDKITYGDLLLNMERDISRTSETIREIQASSPKCAEKKITRILDYMTTAEEALKNQSLQKKDQIGLIAAMDEAKRSVDVGLEKNKIDTAFQELDGKQAAYDKTTQESADALRKFIAANDKIKEVVPVEFLADSGKLSEAAEKIESSKIGK